MAITFDENGNMVMGDQAAVDACPTDPDELNQCEGCQ